MNNPKPEHRITAVEKRVTHIEGAIEELASDNAEDFKALRQNVDANFEAVRDDIKQGFAQAHTYIQESIETRLDEHGKRLGRIETTQIEQGAMLKEILDHIKKEE